MLGMTEEQFFYFLFFVFILVVVSSSLVKWFLGINELLKEQKEQTKILTEILDRIKQKI